MKTLLYLYLNVEVSYQLEVEEARPEEKNTWKGMKKDYLKDNPDAKTDG